jgi:hypothetical protein
MEKLAEGQIEDRLDDVRQIPILGALSYGRQNERDALDDLVFQRRAGAGLGLRLSNGRRPVWLDLGADYHRNGMATYLTEGDIVDQSDGSVVIYPRRTEANLWSFRVGVSVGFGGDRGRHDDDWRRR